MTAVELYLRLALGLGVLLLPGWLLARALGVRGVPAALAWSLTVVFACLVRNEIDDIVYPGKAARIGTSADRRYIF